MLQLTIHKTVNSVQSLLDLAPKVGAFSGLPGIKSIHITVDSSTPSQSSWEIKSEPEEGEKQEISHA